MVTEQLTLCHTAVTMHSFVNFKFIEYFRPHLFPFASFILKKNQTSVEFFRGIVKVIAKRVWGVGIVTKLKVRMRLNFSRGVQLCTREFTFLTHSDQVVALYYF